MARTHWSLVVVAALVAVALPAGPPVGAAAPAPDELRCTILGTPGDDVLVGTSRADVICGRGGADRLLGGAGDDVLVGGPGDDQLVGGAGDDRLNGGLGDDDFRGGAGDDTIRARDKAHFRDVVSCGTGRDHVRGNPRDQVARDCDWANQGTPPRDVTLTPASVAEDAPVGTLVGLLAAVDPDSGGTPTFQLVSGAGSADNAGFAIVGRRLRTTRAVDFETDAVLSVRVRATDPGGLRHEEALTVAVTDVPEGGAPEAVDDRYDGTEDTTLTLPVAGAGSPVENDTDADGDPLTVTDVSNATGGTVSLSGGAIELAPAADLCGVGAVRFDYVVSDGNGGTDTGQVTVDVACVNDAPRAVGDTATVDEDAAAAAVDVLVNDTDVDSGPIAITSVTQPDHGTVVITGGGAGLTYAPDANYCNAPPGTTPDTFSYTLNGGSTATVEVSVTCAGDAPRAVDDSATVDEDAAAAAVDVLANDTDVDGGPMVVDSVTQPDHGTVAITGGGTGLTYAPDADYCNDPTGGAADTFSYTLNGGSTATVEVTVTCVADAPVAVDDTATVDEDAAATGVDVLANDTDVDGGPMVVDSVTQPDHGTVAITGGGTGLTYAPDADYCNDPTGGAADTFSYTLNGGSTATVEVTVTCVADAPVAVDDTATVDESAPATAVDVLANEDNPDGGAITIASVTDPGDGTVVVTGGGTGLTYEPDAGYCNDPPGTTPDTFSYTLAPGGSTADVAVTVTCVDDAPAGVDDTATVTEDSAATAVDVLANDTDVDGGPIAIDTATQPDEGTVVITGGGTGLTYEPDADYCNAPPGTTPDAFTYTLNGGSTATVSVTVTCVDDAPVAVDDTATVAEDGAAAAIDVLANDTDVDAGTVTIDAVTQPDDGTVAITGGGTGLTYLPDADYCNNPPGTTPDTFTYTLDGGSTAAVAVTVTCDDDAPVAVDDTAMVDEDTTARAVDVLANDTDVDGGAMVVDSVTQPDDGTVVITGAGTGLTYLPDADYCNDPPGTTPDAFTYTLAPGGSTATVAVTVICDGDAPVAVGDTATVAEDAAAAAVAVLANDTDVDGGPMVVDSVTQPDDGTVVITGGGTGLTYRPDANYCNAPPGTTPDAFTYTLNGGSTATVEVTVTCVADPPVAVGDTSTVAEDAAAAAVAVLANDTDVDGGAMVVDSVTQPDDGTVVITGGGTGLTYAPDADYCNAPPGTTPDSFTYTLNGGSTATVEMTVTCVADPPVAVDDTATVAEDAAAAAVAVLTNDTDVDGGPIAIGSVTQPDHGTVVITGGGTGLTYVPDADYCNTPPGTTLDTFSYTLAPGGSTADVEVTVTCADDAPVAVGDTATVTEDAAAAAVTVLTNDTDVDAGPRSISSVSDPTNGTVLITGGGTGLTYKPDANYCNNPPGTTLDTFTYTLAPGGSTASVAVTVTCVNDAPVADDETFTGALSAVGNTALVVDDAADAAPASSGATKVITGSILTGDGDIDGPGPLRAVAGTFATNDGGSVVLQADGDFTFVPAAGTSCTDTSDFFDYTVSDQATPTAGTDTGRVTITITGCVWYVDNAAAGDDAGTSADPFDTLAQAEAASAAGHTIHVADGDGTTTGYAAGIALKSNQSLVGGAVDLRVGSDLLLAGAPAARPTLTDLNADVVSLASGATVTGLDVDPQGIGGGISGGTGVAAGTITDVKVLDTGVAGTQPGLELDATTGTFNVANLTVQTSGAVGVRLANAGTVAFAPTGTISIASTGARGLVASDTALGASVFDSVTVTGSGSGAVQLSATTGSPTFTNLDLTTTSGAVGAFVLNNAGTVTVPGAGAAEVTAQGGPAVDVTATVANLAFDDVTSSGSTGSGISLNALGVGTFSTATGSISGASGTAFVVSGASSGDVTFPGMITDGPGDSVSVTGRTGGTVTLSNTLADGPDVGGGITVSGNSGGSTLFLGAAKSFTTVSRPGVSLASNTGHTVTFGGGPLSIASTSGGGLLSSGGGTLVVSGTGSTVTTTTGSALLIDNTTIGAGNVTFRSVTTNGAPVGIRANNTGSSGRLIVTGNGGTCVSGSPACSGGVLANGTGADDGSATPSGTGIVLNNTLNPSFTRMWVHDFANYAVRGTSVAGLTLADSVVNGVNGTNGAAPYDESSIRLDNLTGSASVSDTYIAGGYEDNMRVVNTAGSLDRITLTGVTFDSATGSPPPGNDALLLQTDSTAGSLHATITDSTFANAAGDLFQLNHSGAGTGDLVLTGNTFRNNHPSIATGGGGVSLFQSGTSGSTTMSIANNSFRDAVGPGVLIVKSAGPATQTGTFANNAIGVGGVANSGSREGSALKLQLVSQGTSTWSVTDNTIRGYNNHGIEVLAGGGGTIAAGTFNTTVTGNDIAQPGTLSFVKQGIHYNIGTLTGDTFQTCADIRSNTISNGGVDADIRLRQRQATTIRLPGYVGGNSDNTAVQNFVDANNPPATTLAVNSVPTGGGFIGTGTTCP